MRLLPVLTVCCTLLPTRATPGRSSKSIWRACSRTARPAACAPRRIGSGFWHVHGSSDGRFAVGDDFSRSLYLIDRASHEVTLPTTGHKTTAADHPHPTFSPDGTRIEIQSATLSADGRTLNICIVPVPRAWRERAR